MSSICRRCLMREMAEADAARIEHYKEAIKEEDRVAPEIYENRLSECKACEKLNAGTCMACGCYVELRALGPACKCPCHHW